MSAFAKMEVAYQIDRFAYDVSVCDIYRSLGWFICLPWLHLILKTQLNFTKPVYIMLCDRDTLTSLAKKLELSPKNLGRILQSILVLSVLNAPSQWSLLLLCDSTSCSFRCISTDVILTRAPLPAAVCQKVSCKTCKRAPSQGPSWGTQASHSWSFWVSCSLEDPRYPHRKADRSSRVQI